MTFRVGMKVVCVSEPVVPYVYDVVVQPVVGEIYTIRDIGWHGASNDKFGPSIRLVELRSPIHPCGEEFAFYGCRFRPAVERKTDISCFTKMLRQEEHHGLV